MLTTAGSLAIRNARTLVSGWKSMRSGLGEEKHEHETWADVAYFGVFAGDTVHTDACTPDYRRSARSATAALGSPGDACGVRLVLGATVGGLRSRCGA